QRGYDVTAYALNCFGGAGGQHACLVADALGMSKVLIHPMSGLLSAYGMGLADIRATHVQALDLPLDSASEALARMGKEVGELSVAQLVGQGVQRGAVTVSVSAHIRYAGTDTTLEIPALVYYMGRITADHRTELHNNFLTAHWERFGFVDETK